VRVKSSLGANAVDTQSEKEPNRTEFTVNAVLIREQLNRLLAHPLFTNSKRYPVLLAYTVEQALLGNASELKERTIGVEAFGRKPDYDVNLDPVVRTTAAEVRKRLSQYYYNTEHAGELVIEVPVGSYIPLFREHPPHLTIRTDTLMVDESPEVVSQGRVESERLLDDSPNDSAGRATYGWTPIASALFIAAFFGFGIGHMIFPGQAARFSGPSEMDRFWEPITATASRITYCLGVPTDAVDLQSRTIPAIPAGESGSLNVYDVIALARSIAPLVPKSGEFRVLAASETSFVQLREGPSVMIGAFDNPWTMRITQDLPIGFEYDNHVRKVVNRKSVPKGIWTLKWQIPMKSLARDYAVVARIHDPISGQPVIILAGILGEGTEAASEVVSNPAYLSAMLKEAPKNWDKLSLEAIIEADVIEGHPGPPTVIAVETW
jgi:hypothetical protein